MEINERLQNVCAHFDYRTREQLESKDTMTVQELLTSQDASVLVPKVIVGIMREAAESMYLGSTFMPEIRLESGVSVEFPSVGVLRAHFVPEGHPYPEEELDFQRHRQPMDVRVRKVGLKIKVTDEAISDNQWDVIGLHLRQGGRAMARFKEEWCFREWVRHGHTVFDNSLSDADAHTTGLGPDGHPNNTLSFFDFVDMAAALMSNGFTPTTLIMHPLTWTVFAKNEVLGSLSSHAMIPGMYLQNLKPASGSNVLADYKAGMAGQESMIRGALPLPFEVLLSPFIPFDRVNRTYDMFLVDRNNIGVTIVREGMSTEEFDDPAKDIRAIKIKERYSPAIFYEGRAVAVVKNIALAPSYNMPLTVRQV